MRPASLNFQATETMIDFVNEDGAAPILLDKERMADMEFEDITDDDEDFYQSSSVIRTVPLNLMCTTAL